MTLVEVLVAMSVLLVGIWGVAKGFPTLMQSVREEGRRGQMTQLARATTERLLANPAGLPQDTDGGPDLSPQAIPQNPDSLLTTDNPANSRDDWDHVVGEQAVIPGVAAGAASGTSAIYALQLGRANPSGTLAVTAVQAVTSLPSQPPALVLAPPAPPAGSMPDNCFYLDPTGTISADPAITLLEITYAWLDNSGTTHWVQREQVPLTVASGSAVASGTVAAAGASNFDSAIEGSAWGDSLITFAPQATGSTPGPQQVVPDPTGATLLFNPQDSGTSVLISYDLASSGGRRARELFQDQVMSEELATPDPAGGNISDVTVQLTATGLDGEDALSVDLPAGAQTHVLAVDLANGNLYYEGDGIDPQTGIDWNKGRVTVQVPNVEGLGHTFRFFYQTLDQGMLTVMRAPSFYMPADLFGATNAVQQFATQAPNAGGFTVLDFTTGADLATSAPVSVSAGATVAVDYTYGSDPNSPQRATGELHTINTATRQITLDNPNVLSVIAVRGISVTVRAWWRTQSGRLEYVDVDNLASAAPPA
jgi:type II secretory pathway pseudopilin PulG